MASDTGNPERMTDCTVCGGARYFNLTHQCSSGTTTIVAGPITTLVPVSVRRTLHEKAEDVVSDFEIDYPW